MPLSKKRDKARKRIERAVQPVSNPNPVQPVGLIMDGNKVLGVKPTVQPVGVGHKKRYYELTPEEKGVTSYDADGYPVYIE